MTKTITSILCIGGGNMARAIFQGVFLKNKQSGVQLTIIDPNDIRPYFNFVPRENLNYFSSLIQLSEHLSNNSPNNLSNDLSNNLSNHPNSFDLIVLAIKPQMLNEVADDWQVFQQQHPQATQYISVLSILAGVDVTRLAQALAIPIEHITRAMPNMPISVGLGSTALFTTKSTESTTSTESAKTLAQQFIEDLFNCSGHSLWLEKEEDMHAYTALCGSSPAYFFHVLDVMVQYAITQGFDEFAIRQHITQSMQGAAVMAAQNPQLSLQQLQAQVTSKGGTTAAALASFSNQPSLAQAINQGLIAAQNRSKELARL